MNCKGTPLIKLYVAPPLLRLWGVYPLSCNPASFAVSVNIARKIATEMTRPFGVAVVSNSGVFGVGSIPGSAAVYSSHPCKGHKGEPVSAGIGTGVLPFCVCNDLVHLSATIIPCFEGVTSAHDVCLPASNWSIVGGAIFEILR